MDNAEHKPNIAGVDVASEKLVMRWSVDTKVYEVDNNPEGIRKLCGMFRQHGVRLVVCEHTGRHEWNLMQALWSKSIPAHCAHPRAVCNFAKALKSNAKSDPIDADVLLQYGLRMDVKPTSPPSPELVELQALSKRRADLNKMLVDEKNRLKSPALAPNIKKSIKRHIGQLEKMLEELEGDMQALVSEHQSLKAPVDCLDDEYGVGFVTAATIYANMPELGTLTRQTAAALAGLAPFVRSSGKYSGKQRISGGRTDARTALYMVALTVIRKVDGVLRNFYLRLKQAGKHTSVALTAVMRKLIIRLNSRMKELRARTQILPTMA